MGSNFTLKILARFSRARTGGLRIKPLSLSVALSGVAPEVRCLRLSVDRKVIECHISSNTKVKKMSEPRISQEDEDGVIALWWWM
jgi:hypothetical protein